MEPFRREGDRVRVSVDGGGQPKWRGDGKELFFTTPRQPPDEPSRCGAGRPARGEPPAELFEIRGLQGPDFDDYAPSADGQRFLVKLPSSRASARRCTS